MLFEESKIIDFLIGAFLFGVAMLYLYSQNQTVDHLNDIVSDKVLEQKNLYQQNSNIDLNKITDAELKAIIMGYREYPIVIDGTVVQVDDMDYEKYFPLIKEGYYIKSYKCNSNNDLTQVIYAYAGRM